MQNYLKKLIQISLIGIAFIAPASAQSQNLISDDEANSIVLSYIDALGQGDTITIKQLIGGKFLEKRRNILDNPSYSQMLSKLYGSASSKILNTEQFGEQSIAVDTLIELNKDEILQCRFIVSMNEQQQLKIIEELEHSKN